LPIPDLEETNPTETDVSFVDVESIFNKTVSLMKDTHFAVQGMIKVATKVQPMQMDSSLKKGYMEELKKDFTTKHLSFFFINNAPNVQ
jgi:hypothetical protein